MNCFHESLEERVQTNLNVQIVASFSQTVSDFMYILLCHLTELFYNIDQLLTLYVFVFRKNTKYN